MYKFCPGTQFLYLYGGFNLALIMKNNSSSPQGIQWYIVQQGVLTLYEGGYNNLSVFRGESKNSSRIWRGAYVASHAFNIGSQLFHKKYFQSALN